MITYRFLEANDYELLASSLSKDEYHTTTLPMFFVEPETLTLVYEDEVGPVMFVRGKGFVESDKQILQLDIQYVSNENKKRNAKVMFEEFPKLVKRAKENGFNEIVFESNVPVLRAFCVKRLGFSEDAGQKLRYIV